MPALSRHITPSTVTACPTGCLAGLPDLPDYVIQVGDGLLGGTLFFEQFFDFVF